jgi:hypothetical protein
VRDRLDDRRRQVDRRAWAWLLGVLFVLTGSVLTLLAVLDTQRVCVGLMDDACGAPNASAATVKFALALMLFALSPLVVKRIKRPSS